MTPEEIAKHYLAHDRYGADAKGLSQAYLDLREAALRVDAHYYVGHIVSVSPGEPIAILHKALIVKT